jgi:hypothetical protein
LLSQQQLKNPIQKEAYKNKIKQTYRQALLLRIVRHFINKMNVQTDRKAKNRQSQKKLFEIAGRNQEPVKKYDGGNYGNKPFCSPRTRNHQAHRG